MRRYYLTDLISMEIADSLSEFLENSLQKERVYLYLDSRGGNAKATGKILNAMKIAQNRGVIVYTVAIGDVGSGAFLVFGEGSKGCRLMLPEYRGRIHLPELEKGSPTLSEQEQKKLLILRQQFADEIVKFSNSESLNREWVYKNDNREFTASELVELGIADMVLETKKLACT